MNRTSIHEDTGLIPGLDQWVRGSGVATAHRRNSVLVLLWLWCRPAAESLFRPLTQELPCAVDVSLKRQKKKKKKRKKKKNVKKKNEF